MFSAFLLASASTLLPSQAFEPEMILCVGVEDSMLNSVAGSVVEIRQGANAPSVSLTSRAGLSRYEQVDADSVAEIRIGPASTIHGDTLGITRTLLLPEQTPHDHTVLFRTTQPLLQPVVVDARRYFGDRLTSWSNPGGRVPLVPHQPDFSGGLWKLLTEENVSYTCNLKCGMLVDQEEIQAHFEFSGLDIDYSGYVAGFVIRSADEISIGLDSPLAARVLFPEHDFSTGSVVDAFFVPAGSGAPMAPEGAVISSTTGDVDAFFAYYGTLGAGDTIVLLKAGFQGVPSEVQLAQRTFAPTAIPPGAVQGGGSITIGMLEREEVHEDEERIASLIAKPTTSPARPNTLCTPKPPTIPDCADPGTAGIPLLDGCPIESLGLRGRKQTNIPLIPDRNGPTCKPPGGKRARSTTVTEKMKATLNIMTPLYGVEVFSYEIEGTDTTIDEWTANPGAHGLGECFMPYQCNKTCVYGYRKTANIVCIVKEPVVMETVWGSVILWYREVDLGAHCPACASKKEPFYLSCSTNFQFDAVCSQAP